MSSADGKTGTIFTAHICPVCGETRGWRWPYYAEPNYYHHHDGVAYQFVNAGKVEQLYS